MSDQPTRDSQTIDDDSVEAAIEDESSVADLIGERMMVELDEGVQAGHGTMPVFLVVVFVIVFLWAMLAWQPWTGY